MTKISLYIKHIFVNRVQASPGSLQRPVGKAIDD